MPKVEILQQNGGHFLWVDGYLWMWDIPIEREAQKEVADQALGDVLVAGYGLGIVQQYLLQNPNVKSVTTVEIFKDVVSEAERVYGKIYGSIEIGDFHNFPEARKFDVVVGDIWEDLVPAALDQYRKFKGKAEKLLKPNGKILAWGQEFMEYLLKSEHESAKI